MISINNMPIPVVAMANENPTTPMIVKQVPTTARLRRIVGDFWAW
jgi:hypothetical protein